MIARPILMHARSILNLLDGRKTQTRRLSGLDGVNDPRVSSALLGVERGHEWVWQFTVDGQFYNCRCPYGQPGDLLWVRETFAYDVAEHPGGDREAFVYRASSDVDLRWVPSIHMPRRASRLTLRLTDVRVERVQAITAGDAVAEGCPPVPSAWRDLWNDTNGDGAFERNPFVWCLTFEVLRENVDSVLARLQRLKDFAHECNRNGGFA